MVKTEHASRCLAAWASTKLCTVGYLHKSKIGFVSCCTLFTVCIFTACQLFAIEEPAGYRLSFYDDEVPDTLTGAIRVTAQDVLMLQSTDSAVVVDVIPQHRKPDDMPEGQMWFPVPHKGISGALWLPDVGYGVLSETTESYFVSNLQKATRGKMQHPVVFYCRRDCWMSWNAAKRAVSLGYTRVYWFAEGIDDWRFEGFDIVVLEPVPGDRH